MGQEHVEMALVHRNVSRLTDRTARMVQPFGHIAQLHEIAEILNRGIAATTLGIMHEGRAIDRRQDQIATTDLNIALGVARILGKGLGRCGNQLAGQTARNMHPLALHIRPRRAPQRQRPFVLDKVDTYLFQNGLGVPFNDLQRFFVQNLEIRNVALDELCGLKGHRGPFRATGRPAATPSPTPCCNIVHESLRKLFCPLCGMPDKTRLGKAAHDRQKRHDHLPKATKIPPSTWRKYPTGVRGCETPACRPLAIPFAILYAKP